jgi:hypothetical protein
LPENSTKLQRVKPELDEESKQNSDKPQDLSGYLHKWSPALFSGWQERYFKLENKKIKWFKNDFVKIPQGVLNFDHFECTLEEVAKDQCCFNLLLTGNRNFQFKANTPEVANAWKKELNRHIKASEGFLRKKSAKDLKKPWKFDNMSEAQFLAQADTGDILLFRQGAMQIGGAITRTFTNSHFDHVAMVLKFETAPDEVFLVEATGNMGVSLNRWVFLRPHIGSGKFYEKMVYRHIKFDRGDKMVNNLEKFLSEAVGLKYGLSGDKLLKKKTVKMPT